MRSDHLSKCFKNDKGFAIVLIAIMLVVLLGFLALGIDAGYLYIVKGELQNAADAGALAGGGVLLPLQGSPPTPNWTSSQQVATEFVQSNKAAGAQLVEAQITPGYWNLKHVPAGIQPQSITL